MKVDFCYSIRYCDNTRNKKSATKTLKLVVLTLVTKQALTTDFEKLLYKTTELTYSNK